jgi:hypothetical protein
VVAPGDFYPVYFSQGVLLEAQLIASRLSQPGRKGAGKTRIVQVFRKGDIGAAAAARLPAALSPGEGLIDRALGACAGPQALAEALREAADGGIFVLWLRTQDLAALSPPPSGIAAVYASGVMGGLERAPLPPAWRNVTRLAYPYELPDARSLFLNYPFGWFRLYRIPIVAERVQVDTFIVCSVLLTQALSSMLGDYQGDYLVERVEAMLSSRIVNGYYTRLGLAPGQRCLQGRLPCQVRRCYRNSGGSQRRLVRAVTQRLTCCFGSGALMASEIEPRHVCALPVSAMHEPLAARWIGGRMGGREGVH